MNIQNSIAILGVIGTASGAAYFIEDRYIDVNEHSRIEKEVGQVNNKLEIKILTDELFLVKDHGWKIDAQLRVEPGNMDLRKARDELKLREDQLIKDLDRLKSQGFVLRNG